MNEAPIRWHPSHRFTPMTIDQFHEWNITFAQQRFAAKRSNDDNPVTFFNMWWGDTVHVMEAHFIDEPFKHAVFDVVRGVCLLDTRLTMLSFISEVWVAQVSPGERQGRQVRDMPGREDALMVGTYSRDGGKKMTRWVARLKVNPDNNRLLARDDIDMSKEKLVGPGVNFFDPMEWHDDL